MQLDQRASEGEHFLVPWPMPVTTPLLSRLNRSQHLFNILSVARDVSGSHRRTQSREAPESNSRADYWNTSYLLSDPREKGAWEAAQPVGSQAVPTDPVDLGICPPAPMLSPQCSLPQASYPGIFLQRQQALGGQVPSTARRLQC